MLSVGAGTRVIVFLLLAALALSPLEVACTAVALAPTQTPAVEPGGTGTATPGPSPLPTNTAIKEASPTATQPPAPTVVTLPTPQLDLVSQEELWEALRGFSGKTNQQREAYIAQELFPKAGLTDITRQPVTYKGPWGEEYGNWDNLGNIFAWRKGSQPNKQGKRIIVGGHFDKVTYPGRSPSPGRSDGILDNASGVAAIAKIAQALKEPLNDIMFVAFATEEPQPFRLGSHAYFDNLPDKDKVLVYINLDVLGRGRLALVEGSAEPALAEVALQAAKAEDIPLVWRAASHQTNSDQLAAQDNGLKVLAITCDGFDWYHIHVPEDNLSALEPDTYYQHYRLAASIIAAVDRYLAQR